MKNITLSYSVPMNRVAEVEKKIKDTMRDVTFKDEITGEVKPCTKGRAFIWLVRNGYHQLEMKREEQPNGT